MRTRLAALAVLAFTLTAGCGGSSDSTSPTTGTPPGGGGGGGGGVTPVLTNAVTVSDNKFEPSDIQVSPGTTVTWTWGTPTLHNVTFADGPASGNKNSGATFSRTFSTAGTFTYQCTIHAGMNGSVLVK
jgi:plastocyanin